MIDKILDAPQLMWLVAFLIYATDVARRIAPGCMLLLEHVRGTYRPILSREPFEFGKKELYAPGILAPWSGVFVARWDSDSSDIATVADAARYRGELLPLRIVSSANFALLFLCGPMLTMLIGLGGALLILAPIVYAANAASGVFVIVKRDRFNVGRAKGWWLLLDVLLCAPYGANWVKRLCRLQPLLTVPTGGVTAPFSEQDVEQLSFVLAQRRLDGAE